MAQDAEFSFLAHLDDKLHALRAAGLGRTCTSIASAPGPRVSCAGRDMLLLASNNYLGLASDPRVIERAAHALRQYGSGTGGSRLTTGTGPLHRQLEQALARFKGTEAALLFNTGYMANVGVITALCGRGDVIFSDRLNHASIIDACRQSQARIVVYAHNDMTDLAACIEREARAGNVGNGRGAPRGLVVSDAVFSMDGDVAPLPELTRLAHSHGLPVMVDEAHATGVLGATGRGIVEYFGEACDRPDIIVGTLSKALGSEGGFVCGEQRLVDWLVNTSRPFIFSTALPAASVAAALAALEILEAEPFRVARLHDNVRLMCQRLHTGGIAVDTPSAIVPVLVGDEDRAVAAAQHLFDNNCLVSAIRYPSVPRGAARLRVTLSSEHTAGDITHASGLICAALRDARNGQRRA